MLPGRIASRYAKALFDLAQQQGKTEAWEGELQALAAVIVATPELSDVLTHPEVPLARKEALVNRAFAGQVSREVLALLFLLIRRGHEPDIRAIHTIYVKLWNAARKVMPVTVTTAAPMSEAQADALSRTLSGRLGATVTLHRKLDPEILAGMVVTIGDRVIDASARATLERLRLALAEG